MKDLEIKVRLDRSQAKAQAAAHVADAKAMTDATAGQVAAQKKGLADVASQEDRALRDALGRFVKRGQAASDAAAIEAKQSRSFLDGIQAGIAGLGRMAAGYATVQVAARGMQAVADMWKDQRKSIEDSVDRLTKYRESVLELAALKDRLGNTTAETAEQLRFRAVTLQTQDQARSFQQGAMNTGQSSVAAGFVTKEQFNVVQKQLGAYQAATNADPTALGSLAGTMPRMIGKQNQSGEDVVRRSVGIFDILQKGASDLGSGVAQYQKNSGLVMPGVFKSPEQLAAVQSAMSLYSADEAGTLTTHLVRGTVGGLRRNRKSTFAGSIGQADYLDSLKVTDQMDVPTIAKIIAADLKAQEGKSAAKGEVFSAIPYLQEHGYMDEHSARAIFGFSQQVNSGGYGKTFEPMARPEAAPAFAAAMAPVAQFQAVDPAAQARKAAVAKDAADAAIAMGPEGLWLQAKRQAFETLKAQPGSKMYGEFESWNGGGMNALWEGPIIAEAGRQLKDRARAAGVVVPEGQIVDYSTGMRAPNVNDSFAAGPTHFMTSEATRAKMYADIDAEIIARGGKALNNKDVLDRLDRIAKSSERQEANMRAGVPGVGQAPPPARPVGP